MNFFEKNLYIKLVLIIAAIIILSVYFLNLKFFNKEEERAQPVDSGPTFGGVICGVSVEQPECYNSDFPAPVFKWEYCGGDLAKDQKSFRVRVDSQAYQDSTFLSPGVDTQKIESSENKYSLNGPGLEFDAVYYWGVDIENNNGQQSGWWGWGSKNFKTAPSCKFSQ